MSALRWNERPEIERPIVVAAFAGWNDAGDAATDAVSHLSSILSAEPFADIDPEEFYDFTVARPVVSLDRDLNRTMHWPENVFSATTELGSRHAIFLNGVEPQLKWRTFTDAVMECAMTFDAQLVLTLGALLADVPHTRPSPVTAHATDPELLRNHGWRASQYEGPTGIIGVLHDAAARRGIRSASLWAAVPHYVGQIEAPRAKIALIKSAAAVLDVVVGTTDHDHAIAAYERRVSEIIDGDEDMLNYIAELEESEDEEALEAPSADTLADEVERFLRDQGQ